MIEQANCQITGVSFRLFTESEAKRLSVLSVSNPTTFDPLGHPIENGLADTSFGPLKRNDFCKTCGLTDSHCLGHFGHISLPLPVFNPFLMKQLFQVLRMFCFNCHHFLFSRANVEVYIAQLRALNLGLDFVLDDLQEYANELTGINAQFDWNSPEGQTYLRGRLNDKINSEYSLLKSNKEKLFAQEEEAQTQASSSSSKPSTSTASQVKSDGVPLATLESVEIMNSKNVVEKKQHLFKDFIGGKLVKPGKVCHSCNARKAGMNVINRSLIVLSAAKAAASVAKFNNTANGNNEDSNDSTEGANNATGINIEMKGKSYLTPAQAREHLRRLWAHEKDTLVRIFPFINLDVEEDLVKMSKGSSSKNSSSSCPLDVFFWETIIVSPNRFRPLRFLNGRSFEHYRTSALAELMVVAKSLEYALETAKKNNSGESIARFHGSWQRLQILANRLYDARLDALPDNKAVGVKQILEKKEGLLRKNMMGKRVNFAARSVISPDPYIMVDEIGVPVVFASRLSYPQPVTQWNLHQLQQAVLNGPLVWPGALSVTYEDGYTVRLSPDSVDQRREVAGTLHPPSLAQGMKGVQTVNRHLLSGDVLLLNRQPTLHKPSIMAHKARVLPREKTLRLHYANCKCYNADFDGDEMNAHFPQSELARAEAYGVASVNYQFLVPKDGSPLSGLIQDHIVAGVMLTVRGRFFNKGDYQQLVYGALSFTNRHIRFLPPSILRPAQLWSGKQIISTLVMNLVPEGRPLPSFEIESKIGAKMFISRPPKEGGGYFMVGDKEMCESVVVFRRGELLQGVMDKVNFGANKNGLIHVCYELYGGDVHTRLLTSIARLSTNFLQSHHGFTLGIHDILVQAKPNKERRRLIRTAKNLGTKAVADAFNLGSTLSSGELTEREIEEKLAFAATSRDDFYLKQLDAAYKSHTDTLSNAISGACLPKGLVKPFPSNNLQMMIQAGAKGGSVNAIQISALLGQIELEGRRIPLMMSGRTLPSFRPYETHPRAGGFVTGRFLTGIRPQEFFFHCMAGREGLIDTAVKTSRSGYLQRCLIKHLEGLVVNYDLTVRDSEGSVVQWMYGEDGLDVIRSQCLKKAFFPTIMANVEALKPRKEELARLKAIREPAVPKLMRATRREVAEEARAKKEGEAFGTAGGGKESPFRKFEAKMREDNGGEGMEKEKLVDAWFSLEAKEKGQYYRETPRTADPVISRYRPDLHFGAISETLDAVIAGYIDSDVHLKSTASKNSKSPKDESRKRLLKDFKNTLNVCYQRALCAPGEAVGLLAAQSIGEPSTQMTLNTFHFAGRGEMNVTLGVPRLRELLMTASPNISTPSMDIPFRVDVPLGIDLPAEAEKIRLKLNAVRLKDVLEYVDVLEVLEISPDSPLHRFRTYNVRFQFLPRAAYKRRCFTKPAQVLHYMETVFFKAFIEAMHRRMRLLSKSAGLFDTKSLVTRNRGAAAASKAKKSSGGGDDDDEEERMMGRGGENSNSNEEMMDPEEKRRVTMGDDEDEDEDAEDLDLDEGEGDTTAMKHTTRLNQEREYEEADQEEMEGSQDDSDQEEAEEEDGKKVVKEEVDEESSEVPIKKSSKNSTSAAAHSLLNGGAPGASLIGPAADRRNRVLGLGRGTVVDYVFDTAKELWCEVTLRFELASAAKLDLRSILTEEAAKAYVHRVGRIDRAFLVKDNEAAKRGLPFAQLLKTEGVSLASVVEFERLLDLRRIYTNDMHAIARTYGIEAARAALIREISNVFGVYGISVDGRHLSLIADHMTFTGAIKGMNRGAMDGISPLQAMTFETTTNFLKNSLLLDLKDDLHSPSSRLVIGRPTLVGSGLFETRLDPAVLTGMANPNVTFGTTSAMLHSSRSTSMLGGFGLMTPSGGSSSSFLGSGKSAKKGAGSGRLSSGSFLGLGGSIDGSLIGTGSSGIGTMGTAGGWSSSASSARKRPGAPLEDFDADEGYSVGGGSSSAGGEGGIALKEELSPPPPVSASKGTKSKGAKSTTSKSTSKKSSKKSSSSAVSGVATTSSSGPLFATPLAAKRIKFEFDSD